MCYTNYYKVFIKGTFMKKTISILFSILFILILEIGYSDIFITYLSGECTVDLEGKGQWEKPSIDMELFETSAIRTGQDGAIELLIDDNIVSFSENNTVIMEDVLAKIGERKKIGWLKSVTKYAKNMGRGDETYAKTALAGIRGTKSNEDELEWFENIDEEDPNERFQEGRSLFNEGQYTKAIPLFTELIADVTPGTFHSEIAYYLGVSLFHNLRYQETLYYLNESLTQKDAYYYELALLYSSLAHYFLKDYNGAIEGLDLYKSQFSGGDLLPFAIFMLGKSHREIGERERAMTYFMEIKDNYSTSEVYVDALAEIESL
jgi:TolA-binding protein